MASGTITTTNTGQRYTNDMLDTSGKSSQVTSLTTEVIISNNPKIATFDIQLTVNADSTSSGFILGTIQSKYLYIGNRPIVPMVNDSGGAPEGSLWVNGSTNGVRVYGVKANQTYHARFTAFIR